MYQPTQIRSDTPAAELADDIQAAFQRDARVGRDKYWQMIALAKWRHHRSACRQCEQVKPDAPAASCCRVGAPILTRLRRYHADLRDLAEQAQRRPTQRTLPGLG